MMEDIEKKTIEEVIKFIKLMNWPIPPCIFSGLDMALFQKNILVLNRFVDDFELDFSPSRDDVKQVIKIYIKDIDLPKILSESLAKCEVCGINRCELRKIYIKLSQNLSIK